MGGGSGYLCVFGDHSVWFVGRLLEVYFYLFIYLFAWVGFILSARTSVNYNRLITIFLALSFKLVTGGRYFSSICLYLSSGAGGPLCQNANFLPVFDRGDKIGEPEAGGVVPVSLN